MLCTLALLLTAPADGPLARLGDVRFRHPGPVTSLAFHPDGKTLVAHADGERFARVWSVPGGELVGKVAEPRYTLDITRVVGFAAGGKRLIVRNDNDEAVTLEPGVRTVEVARWSVRQVVALSKDGSLAAGADTRGRAAVWRTDTGDHLLAVGNVPERKKLTAAFSPDGKRVALAGHTAENTLEVYAVGSPGEPIRVTVAGPVRHVDWMPDGTLAVRRTGKTPPPLGRDNDPFEDVVNAKTGRVEKSVGILVDFGTGVLYPDGSRRAVITDGALGVLTAQPNGTLMPFDETKVIDVRSVAVSADSKVLAVGMGTTVRLFDAVDGGSLSPTGHSARPAEHLAVSADGRRVLAAGGPTVTLWDADAGRVLHTWTQPNAFTVAVALSPDGRTAAALTLEGDGLDRPAVTAWDASNGSKRFANRSPGLFGLFGIDTAGQVWVGDRKAAVSVQALDPATGQPAPLPAVGGGRWAVFKDGRVRQNGPAAGQVAVSQSGLHVAVPWNRGLLGWPVRGPGRPVVVPDLLPNANDHINTLHFTADGRLLAWSKTNDTAVRFWDVHVWAERFRFEPPGGVRAFAPSADGRRLVVAHPDGTLTVWDARRLEDRSLPDDPPLPPAEAWEKLGSPDARVGLAAVRALARTPAAAVKLLAARMPPVEPGAVRQLVADLDSPAYPVREAASRKLAALGEPAEGAVRAAAERSPSAEARARAAEILRQYATPDGRLPPVLLRAARAVEALERIGTPEAATLLKAWAAGDPASLRAAEAAMAVGRLK